ncbi:MAG: hypothetical protein QXF15_00055 [Candidatus Aenigmatarchaeota archaeon]
MKASKRLGFGFGLTSGVITTLGLLIGLYSGSNSIPIIIAGILTIAIADAFSDALAVHISQESENQHTTKEIWESTLFTFLFKFIFASIFIVPIILFELSLAVIISIILGLSLICIFSLNIAKQQNKNYLKVVIEHLTIAVIVIIATYYIGYYIKKIFI